MSCFWSIDISDPVQLAVKQAHAVTPPPLCFQGVCFGSRAHSSLVFSSLCTTLGQVHCSKDFLLELDVFQRLFWHVVCISLIVDFHNKYTKSLRTAVDLVRCCEVVFQIKDSVITLFTALLIWPLRKLPVSLIGQFGIFLPYGSLL